MVKNIGIFFGSNTGNSEYVAKKIARAMDPGKTQVYNVKNANIADVYLYPHLILGCCTWSMGHLQEDFDSFLIKLKNADLCGKRIAIFGVGDQDAYPTKFADSIGIIHEALNDKGCEFIGKVPVSGYSFKSSKALIGNEFIGLPIDETNQGDLTLARIKSWTDLLKKNFSSTLQHQGI